MFSRLFFVIAIAFPLVAAEAQPDPPGPPDGWAVVDCNRPAFVSVGNWNKGKKRNTVVKGSTLTWFLIGPTNTVVDFEFTSKESCEGTSPFEGSAQKLTHTIKNEIDDVESYTSPPVAKTVTKDCYSYKVTCTFPNGTNNVIDPIIDIPKGQLIQQEQE